MRSRALVSALALVVGSMALVSGPAFAAKKTIRWWAPLDWQYKELKAAFEKQNPGVTVDLVSGEVDKFYTMITAGLMPDVWGPWGTPGIRADVNRNWALELGPYIARDGAAIQIDDFFPGLMRGFRVAGKQYSLPIYNHADYYFYNTQLYAEAGLAPPPLDASDRSWNWDRMVQNAEKLTKRDSQQRILVAGTEFNTWPLDSERDYLELWGAEPYDEEALRSSVPQQVHYDTPQMVTALTKAWELINRYHLTDTNNNRFVSGKAGSSFLAGTLLSDYMHNKKLKWAMAPLPWAVTDSGVLWPDGWRISKISKNKELAWTFVKFLCSPENMRFIVSSPKSVRLATPPARKSVFRDTLGQFVGDATGMKPADVYRVHEQMDAVGVVKYQETICLHVDLIPFVDPTYQALWANKISPQAAATQLQKAADKALPVLFKRWIRNIKFTGADR